MRFQEREISAARIEGPDEEERLKESEIILADANGNQFLSQKISETLNADGAIIEELGNLLQEVRGKRSLQNFEQRITELAEMITDLSSEARNFAESIDVDPQSLEEVQERRACFRAYKHKILQKNG